MKKKRIAVAAGFSNWPEYVKAANEARKAEYEDEIYRQRMADEKEEADHLQRMSEWQQESDRLWQVVQDLHGRADEEGQKLFWSANAEWSAWQDKKPTRYI